MTRMERTDQILLLSPVKILVQGDDPDVLFRILIAYKEIINIKILQRKAGQIQKITVVDGSLPGIQRLIVDFKQELLTIKISVVCPVVISIDFCIEH